MIELLAELRRRDVSADADYAGRSVKGQLTQAGRVNASATVVVTVTGRPGLRTVTMRWQLVGRRYRLTHVEAIPPRGKALDLDALARLRFALFETA